MVLFTSSAALNSFEVLFVEQLQDLYDAEQRLTKAKRCKKPLEIQGFCLSTDTSCTHLYFGAGVNGCQIRAKIVRYIPLLFTSDPPPQNGRNEKNERTAAAGVPWWSSSGSEDVFCCIRPVIGYIPLEPAAIVPPRVGGEMGH
jgi:hypothetical protein